MTTKTQVKLRPLSDNIIVRPIEEDEMTASGLVLPDTAKEKPQKGEIIAVGPGRVSPMGKDREPVDVMVGDRVYYAKYAGTEVKLQSDDEVLILKQSDILAVIS